MKATAMSGIRARVAGLVALALVASLAGGCVAAAKTPQIIYTVLPPTPSPSPTVAPTPSGPAASGSVAPATPTPAPGTATISSTTITSQAPDGRWTAKFEKPVVSGVAKADALNASITNKVNSYISMFTGSGLPAVASGDGPSTLDGKFSVAYDTPVLLSIRFTVVTYVTGAAHPVQEIGSINFQVAGGTVVQLPDIFSNPASALTVLTTKTHAALQTKLGSDLVWPSSITMAFFGKAWVFTPAGLEMGWQQGELGPMAAGCPVVSVPWAALKTVLANPGPAAGFVA